MEEKEKKGETWPVKVGRASGETFCMRRTAPPFFRPGSARNSIFVLARTRPDDAGAIQRPTTMRQCETTVHRTPVYAYNRLAISEQSSALHDCGCNIAG